ncbi:hypothetical protein R6Q59_035992 [Mikania micrantha]
MHKQHHTVKISRSGEPSFSSVIATSGSDNLLVDFVDKLTRKNSILVPRSLVIKGIALGTCRAINSGLEMNYASSFESSSCMMSKDVLDGQQPYPINLTRSIDINRV